MDTTSILASVASNPKLAYDPGTISAYQKAGGTLTNGAIPTSVAPTSQPTKSLIVTSNNSRSQFTDNVNNMNTALSSRTPPATVTPSTGTGTDTSGGGGSTPTDSGVQQARVNGGTYQGMDGKSYYKYDGTPADNAPIPPGTQTPDQTSTDGSSSDGSNIDTKGLDPAIAKTYQDSITAANGVLAQRQSDLDAAKATVQNDPAATAALDSIKNQYDVLIKAMQSKNQMLLGGYQTNQARTGALQFANEMSSNFMSTEMDKANGRISDLIAKENDLLLKTTIAYKTGDVKALNAAQGAYDKANTDKLKAIGDLVKATSEHVKQVQAQAKIDAAAVKQTTTLDISKSTNLGKSIADKISQSGVTDPKQIDAYIQEVAKSSGITNPEILRSAVVKAQQDQSKLETSTSNTENLIKNRDASTAIKQQNANKKTTPKTKIVEGKITADDVSSATDFLNKGGTAKSGTVYQPRGTDGFVDPHAYLHVYQNWINNGGSPQGFVKKFPVVGTVNPASYPLLPEAIQPKAKTSAATAPPLPGQ